MRCRIGGVHRIDLSGIRRVIELYVHGHDAVAAKFIEVSPVISTRLSEDVVFGVVFIIGMVFQPTRFPVIAVATLAIGYRE